MRRNTARHRRHRVLLGIVVLGGLLLAACSQGPNPTPNPPVAAFQANPTTGTVPLVVTFTDESTGTITTRQWDFGDTATSTDQSPTHTYDGPGTFTVSLTVTGPGGGTDTETRQIVVNAPPVVNITAPQDGTSFVPDDQVAFTGTASDQEDGDLSSTIAWVSSIDGSLGTGGSVVSTLSSGTHTITASVTDAGAAAANASITVTVNAPPVVNITAPEDGAGFVPDDQVTFTGTASDLEDVDLSTGIDWTSNLDGPLGTGASIPSSLSSGTHTITASVTDAGGKTATDQIMVTVNAAPTVAITSPQEDGITVQFGDSVTFAGSAMDLEDGDLSSSIQWSSSIDNALGTGASINVSTLSTGVHTITASVTDTGGKTGADSITLTVIAPAPVASFAANPTTGVAPLQVAFTDQSTGAIDAWQWDFGDTTTSSGQSPTHVYTAPGTYTASLTVSGPGGTDTLSHQIVVNAPPPAAPVASFTVNPPAGTAPLTVTLNSTSTGEITSWVWSFTGVGSGAVSGANVSHTFLSPGVWTATLLVSGPGGSSMAIRPITVTAVNSAPVVQIQTPTNFSSFSSVATVNFAGTASDAEDGSLTSSIAWTSNRDGLVGTGGSFSTSSLSVGTHTIAASVADSAGMTASQQITIQITQFVPPSTGTPPTLPDPGCPGRCPPREPGDGPPGDELPDRH